jgi:glucan 1,3-beta-glucosidase
MDHTLLVIETIAREIGDKVSVIQLLNEIAGFRGEQWAEASRTYWQAGYDRIRAVAGNDVKVMIGDAFLGLSNWNGFMKNKQGVLMDLVRFLKTFGFGDILTPPSFSTCIKYSVTRSSSDHGTIISPLV